MWRYDIVFGILLILSIIDFALAAPVPVQEKRQARVDVVHILKDVTTILGKRGNEELEKLLAGFFDSMGKSVDLPDTHASSISPPPEPGHGSESSEHDVKAPTANPALPQANLGLSMEPLSPSPITYIIPGEKGEEPTESDIDFMYEDEVDTSSSSESSGPISSPTSTSDHELTGTHVPEPNPNKRPSTGPDPDFDWDHWMNVVNSPRPKRPKLASSNEFDQAHENQLVPQPNSLAGPSTHFDMTDIFGPDDLLLSLAQPSLPSLKEFSQAHVEQAVHVPQPSSRPLDPGTSNRGPSDTSLQTDPGNRVETEGWPNLPMPNNLAHEVLQGPLPTPESTDPELHLDHQSLSTVIQPEDLPAAIYAAKGKTKEEEDPAWIASTSGSSEN